ncbi:hypothetical protein B0H17DRAFT_319265 [Mycena rosella]|uniref:Uncharacterized protein n=1 Tax=Mycena rosella TaxID=1033263 RepID=A0AAD7CT55_MYCRO|nr:hypothetical protein B0H17DRAFT_319265 [Mycena rosella]
MLSISYCVVWYSCSLFQASFKPPRPPVHLLIRDKSMIAATYRRNRRGRGARRRCLIFLFNASRRLMGTTSQGTIVGALCSAPVARLDKVWQRVEPPAVEAKDARARATGNAVGRGHVHLCQLQALFAHGVRVHAVRNNIHLPTGFRCVSCSCCSPLLSSV